MKTATTYLGQDMDVVETQEIAGGCAAVYSARCPSKETVNEDGAALIPVGGHGAVLAVADGLGGAQAGDLAARITIETLRCSIEEASHDPRPLRAAILDGIEQANREVQARGVGAATTLAVAEIDGGVFRPYHVGDSVILLMGGRGKVKLQTVSHSPVGFGVEAGL